MKWLVCQNCNSTADPDMHPAKCPECFRGWATPELLPEGDYSTASAAVMTDPEGIEALAQLAAEVVRKVMTENIGVHEPGKWRRMDVQDHLSHLRGHVSQLEDKIVFEWGSLEEDLTHAVCRSVMAYAVFKEENDAQ